MTMPVASATQKCLHAHIGLAKDGPQRPLGHIARVIGNGGVPLIRRPIPDFKRSSRLAIKREAQLLETLHNVAIAKTSKSPHSAANHKGHLESIRDWQGFHRFASLSPGLDQTSGHIAGDLQGFRHGSPLRNQSGYRFTGGKKESFRQVFHLKGNHVFGHFLILFCALAILVSNGPSSPRRPQQSLV
jgi:hypothetical protein